MARPTLKTLLVLKAVAILLVLCGLWRAAVIVYVVPDLWVLYNLFVPSAQGLCRSFTHFATGQPEIWLTIDDGPDPADTPQILDLLDRHQARATFFLIGERAAQQPDLVREIVRRGHEVGHHTHTHPVGSFWCASRTRLHAELDTAIGVLQPLGPALRWFRAPVGIKHLLLPRALSSRGLQCVGWSIRSGDSFSRKPEAVVARVMRELRPGAIVLVHEGRTVPPPIRVTAIAQLLEALARAGYRCILPAPAQLR